MSGLVTIYIPCRNYGRFLEQAINSVIDQVYSDWELFLIDEGSTDNTREIINEAYDRFPSRIHPILHEEPVGLQRVANKVLSICAGEYIMRLDADDWLDCHALLLMTSYFQRCSDLGVVFGDYFLVDANGRALAIEQSSDVTNECTSNHRPPHGACTMVKTRDLKCVGGYSEDLDAQDGWDLWFKLIRCFKAQHIALPIFYYRQHTDSMSKDFDRLANARAKIFKKLLSNNGSYKPRVLAIVGAKETYSRAERVPFKQLNGQSLIEKALFELGLSESVTDILVSSDSDRVLEFTRELASIGRVPDHFRLLRSLDVPETIFPLDEILRSGVEFFCRETNNRPDIILFCGIHTSGLRASSVDKSINILMASFSDSVISVCEERDMLFRASDSGMQVLNRGRVQGVTHSHERLYRYNGVLVGLWFDQLQFRNILGEKISYIEMSKIESEMV